jgi:hypothetical protein
VFEWIPIMQGFVFCFCSDSNHDVILYIQEVCAGSLRLYDIHFTRNIIIS